MRWAARTDDNQREIVTALRKAGVSVIDLSSVGNGCPDIGCGHRGRTVLMEIKNGNKPPSERRLTPMQVRWHNNWQGEAVVVQNVDEALSVMGIEIRGQVS